jgi:NAD(P)-dependent dehydrogenase (short-subunit alcohol dehydrogenase family)
VTLGTGEPRPSNANAIVTGAASGIGAAVVRQLRAEGARVAGLDRQWPGKETEQGAAILRVDVDLSDPEATSAAIRRALDWLGGDPTGLVQSAGVYRSRPLLECTVSDWDETFSVNTRAMFVVAQQLVAKRKGDEIPLATVNVASSAAVRGLRSEPAAHYNASKAAMIALTRQMAVEWADRGVRANVVLPGFTDTPMVSVMDDPHAGQQLLDSVVPLRRLGEADECARTICFLASPAASYTTGAEISVDGGLLQSLGEVPNERSPASSASPLASS